jgi:hypothetical protein
MIGAAFFSARALRQGAVLALALPFPQPWLVPADTGALGF